jgi:hypothetical protein
MDKDKREELLKSLESSTEPEGVTAQAADGRLFFIPKEDADRLAIPNNDLYAAFRAVRGRKPRAIDLVEDPCPRMWEWLETHPPHSAHWRLLCITYFDTCV